MFTVRQTVLNIMYGVGIMAIAMIFSILMVIATLGITMK